MVVPRVVFDTIFSVGTGRRTIQFTTKLWEHQGVGAWHFVTLPIDEAEIIKGLYGYSARGFGSLKVHVKLGGVEWDTSLFPDTRSNSYVLPVKKEVRTGLALHSGDEVTLMVVIR